MIEVSLQDLQQLISSAVDAGLQSYISSVEPSMDHIRQAEAKRYIKKMGYKPVMLRKWSDARLITPVKIGDRQNSSVIYSLAEIKKCISSLKLKEMCNL